MTVSYTRLMEFLFYKSSIGLNETIFFEKVKDLFFKIYSIDETQSDEELLKQIVEKVKRIRSATKVKRIFRRALKETALISELGVADITNLNTTALCMLHRNLIGILYFSGLTREEIEQFSPYYHYDWQHSITKTQKFISAEPSRIESEILNYRHWFYRRLFSADKFFFPNALLTSDSFLLTQNQVLEFTNHYKYYWDDFWLFQIPHHGSANSSCNLLHSNIPDASSCFINYGTRHQFDKLYNHPSKKVIADIVATGNSVKLIAINEFSGIKFEMNL